jgi:hypothetical protein
MIWLRNRLRGGAHLGERAFHTINHHIRRRGSSGDADGRCAFKPLRPQIGCVLNVMDTRAMARTRGDQFASVVAVRAANYDNHVALLRKFDGCGLALLGWLANRVAKAHFGIWKARADQLHEMPHTVNGLSGLRDDAEARTGPEALNVFLSQDHVELIQIASQAAHFHVLALAYDDGIKTFSDQFEQRTVRDVYQWAGGIFNRESVSAQPRSHSVRSPVRGDKHGIGRRFIGPCGEPHSSPAQIGQDRFVVNQVTEHGNRLLHCCGIGQSNGISHAKAHSEVRGAQKLKPVPGVK